MRWLKTALASLALVALLGACGGDAQVRQYPDSREAEERGVSGGESEPARRSEAPPRSGGPHPTDDEVTGEEVNPL